MTLKTQKIKELFEFDANFCKCAVSRSDPARPVKQNDASAELQIIRANFCKCAVSSSDANFVIGTDEAGRGPGAGPVFAAAVCFKKVDEGLIEALSVLNDSKQLSEKKREELYEIIMNLPPEICAKSVQAGSVEQIEEMNILNTSLDCMRRSCEEVETLVGKASCVVLVDGNKKIKNYSGVQETVVKGDSKSAAIAAASILAKVTRDRFMCELAKEFPQYSWAKNKGYLTASHVKAIKEFGATKWHRAKFLRKIIATLQTHS